MSEKKESGNKEVLITKEYKTMGGFVRGCRCVLNRAFGDGWGEDMLTMCNRNDDRTVEDRVRAGEFVEHNDGFDPKYKAGFEFEFPDRIYAFIQDREVNE